jgi:hypothetical protein
MSPEQKLVPTANEKPILVPKEKATPEQAISGGLEAVESVATPKPVEVGKQWKF